MTRFVEVEIRRDGEEISGLGDVTRFLVGSDDAPGDTLRFTIQPDAVLPTVIELRFVGVVRS